MQMEITRKKTETVDVATLKLSVAVRYDEEDIPNDFPGRDGDTLTLVIDLDERRVRNWPAGREAKIHMKVCDCGSYWLIDRAGDEVASIEADYVPSVVGPGGYGDYLILDIGPDGVVGNLNPTPGGFARFFPED